MCGGSPSAPAPPPRLPEAARAPEARTDGGTGDRDKRRRAAAGGGGPVGTILTGARGTTGGAATAAKTLLGQ